MNEFPDWLDGVTPKTNINARVIATRSATDVNAIEIVGGKYRGATLSDIFELVNPPTAELPRRVPVRCSWFGVTPPNTYPKIDLSKATVKILRKYSGQVVHNIGLDK